jgi:hypothetical protein
MNSRYALRIAIHSRSGPIINSIGKMLSENQIDALALHLVRGLIARGSIKPAAEEKDLVACVVEMMSANFEEETTIEDEADKQAESLARQNPGIDAARLRAGIRQRLAAKRGFTL